jgi:putative alpha-1,2-mannosidase
MRITSARSSGRKGQGNTYPGPAAPFGMVQLSPDTADDLWDNAAGYKYSDTSIMGFSMTHLSGTGIPDRGDFLFIPQIGEPKLVPGPTNNPDAGYRARYSHDQESASAGYYKVTLLNNNVTVELTAAERAGLMRMTFPASDHASILTDLRHFLNGNVDAPGRFKLIWSHVRVEDNSTITGFHLVGGWAKERYLYFAARYSRPFDGHRIYSNGEEVKYNTYRFRSRNEAAGTNLQFVAEYKTAPTRSSRSRSPFPPSAPPTPCKTSTAKSRIGTSTGCGTRRARNGTANWPGCKSKARRTRRKRSTPRCITASWPPAFMRMSMA